MLKKINQIILSPFFWKGVLVFVSLVFTKYYFLFTNEFYPPAYAENIANFEADKVFQKRFLIPVTADFISQNSILSFDKSLKLLNVISTIGLLYYFQKVLMMFTVCNPNSYWCLLLLIPVAWNYMFINSIYHAYDIHTLFFFCLAIYLFLNKKYIFFYVIFAIATINRESTCFITISIALLLLQFKFDYKLKKIFKSNSYLAKHILFQTTIWFFVVLLIRWLFRDSPGKSYEVTYSMKEFFVNMWNGSTSWPYLNTETFTGNPRCFLTLFGCTWIGIPLFWNHIPIHCKKLLLLIPIYMFPALLYANLMETRVYHELNVVISLAFISGLIQYKKGSKLGGKIC